MNQPPENWVVAFQAATEYEADVVKALLADNDITSEMISVHDHMLDAINLSKGVGLYVHKDDLQRATEIINAAEIE